VEEDQEKLVPTKRSFVSLAHLKRESEEQTKKRKMSLLKEFYLIVKDINERLGQDLEKAKEE